MAFNEFSLYGKGVRNAFSGKDASIFYGDGRLLTTVESWQAQVNFNTATFQPLGSPIEQAHLLGYSVTITLVQYIIEDSDFIKQAFDFFTNGRHAPMWTLSSVIHGYDDSESRFNFINCVPEGQWDLHNLSIGDVTRRSISLRCNQPPDLQKVLTYQD